MLQHMNFLKKEEIRYSWVKKMPEDTSCCWNILRITAKRKLLNITRAFISNGKKTTDYDSVYIEEYVKIRNKSGKIISLKLNQGQLKLYEAIKKQKQENHN